MSRAKTQRKSIEKILKGLKFVMWDRFVQHAKDGITFYGWIDREDSYKDFLVLQYNAGEWWRIYRDWETDRKSTRLNSSHSAKSRMPSSA